MKTLKKYSLILSSTCLLTLSSSLCFANAQTIPQNTKIIMSQSTSSQHITAIPATNIPAEKLNTKVNITSDSGSQKITAVPAINIPQEKINTKIDMTRGSNSQKITPVLAKYIK